MYRGPGQQGGRHMRGTWEGKNTGRVVGDKDGLSQVQGQKAVSSCWPLF